MLNKLLTLFIYLNGKPVISNDEMYRLDAIIDFSVDSKNL